MEFCEKLDYLLSVGGVNNSKLAKQIHVDASLVGKWRRGQRQPSNQIIVDEIGKTLSAYFKSDYMRRDLSMMANVPAAQLDCDKAVQNAIITWLSTSGSKNGVSSHRNYERAQGNYRSRLFNEHLSLDRKGRVLVLKKLAAHFERDKRFSCLRLFLDEPCDCLEVFSEYLDTLKAIGCDASRMFERIRLLVPSNISEKEWHHISKIIACYLDYSDITVAILERDHNGVFQHSVIIADDVAAVASFGFYGSRNILSLGYENSAAIRALAGDYDELFSRSCVILRNYGDYTPLEGASKFSGMLDVDADIFYCTYAVPPGLIPRATMKRLISRIDGMGLNSEKHCDVFCCSLSRFLGINTLHTTFVLHSPEDFGNGSVKFPHSHRGSFEDGAFTMRDYAEILRHTLALCEENPNLVVKLVEPEEVEHDLLVQETSYLSISKQKSRKYTYISTNQTLVAYAAKWAREYFAGVSENAEGRLELCSTLHRTAERFEEHLSR